MIKNRIEKTIIEQTNGTAKLEWGDEVTFAEYDGEVLLFKKLAGAHILAGQADLYSITFN